MGHIKKRQKADCRQEKCVFGKGLPEECPHTCGHVLCLLPLLGSSHSHSEGARCRRHRSGTSFVVSGHSLKAPLHHQPARGPSGSPPKSFLRAAVRVESGRRKGCLAQSPAWSRELLPSQHQACKLAGKVGLGLISCPLPPAVSAEATAITTATREHPSLPSPRPAPTLPPIFQPSPQNHTSLFPDLRPPGKVNPAPSSSHFISTSINSTESP